VSRKEAWHRYQSNPSGWNVAPASRDDLPAFGNVRNVQTGASRSYLSSANLRVRDVPTASRTIPTVLNVPPTSASITLARTATEPETVVRLACHRLDDVGARRLGEGLPIESTEEAIYQTVLMQLDLGHKLGSDSVAQTMQVQMPSPLEVIRSPEVRSLLARALKPGAAGLDWQTD
jgi:hypothetical protein